MQKLMLRYRKLTDKFEEFYQYSREKIGLEDTGTNRQALGTFLGVVSCVGIYYVLVILAKIAELAMDATATVIAIIQ